MPLEKSSVGYSASGKSIVIDWSAEVERGCTKTDYGTLVDQERLFIKIKKIPTNYFFQ